MNLLLLLFVHIIISIGTIILAFVSGIVKKNYKEYLDDILDQLFTMLLMPIVYWIVTISRIIEEKYDKE